MTSHFLNKTKLINLIKSSVNEFNLNLKNKIVLTEAASGNFICTPVIAAFAGAEVFAYGKDTVYGKYNKIKKEIISLSSKLNIENKLTVVNSLKKVDLSRIDVLTNTGHLRPINRNIITKLKPGCVIPLIYEPWEHRHDDVDIDLCAEKGIKVYGTNESDNKLKTMDYIGYTVLYFLLKEKKTPLSTKILLIGSPKFNIKINKILSKISYNVDSSDIKSLESLEYKKYDVIVFTEFLSKEMLLSDTKNSKIDFNKISKQTLIINICGKVDIKNKEINIYPPKATKANTMNYTTDFIDPKAVVDLHSGALKVAQGMLYANTLKLSNIEYKNILEKNYNALAFKNKKYW